MSKQMIVSKRAVRSIVLAAAAACAAPSLVHAQTNGTWAVDVGTAGGSWTDPANWVNGIVAQNGGTATFPAVRFTTAPLNIFQDQPNLQLGGIVFDTFITYNVQRPTGNLTNIITLTGPAEIRHNRPSINAWNTLFNGQFISIPLAGSGGMNKRGPGTVSITQPNTYTGGTTISDGGIIRTTVGDAAFGDLSGSITLVDGQIRTGSGAFNSARTFNITGVGTLETTASGAAALSGPMTGPGSFNKTGSARMDLTGNAANSGAFNVHAGSLVIGGASGAISAASSIGAIGTMTLDNVTANHLNRLNDSAPIAFRGSALTMNGNSAADSSETIGNVTFDGAMTFLTVTPGASASATVTAGTASRANGGSAFVRGSNLGATSAPGVANFSMSGVSLVGGGGAAGSTNISIVPWAFGNTSATAAANAATNSLVTIGATGVRPLDINTEYAAAIAPGTASSDNVRITNTQVFNQPTTINALVVAPGGLDISGGGALTITSGALLNLQNGLTVHNPLNFGSREAMILAPATISLNSPISGTGGLTKAAEGNAVFNAASTYTGTTTLAGGTNTFLADVPSGAPGPFGADTSPIVLAGGNFTSVRLQYGGGSTTATFDRDLVNNSANALGNQALLPRFGVATNQTLVMNGDIELNFPLAITGTAGAHVILNGDISGGTFLTDTSTAITITLNGNNTHAGMELLTGTFNVGSDTAFGSGIVKMAGLGSAPTVAAVGGPRIVPNDTVSLRLGGNYWTIAGDQPITFTGSINLSGSFPHVINNSALTTYAGVMHTGGFTKQGTGTLVLSGDNIYTGITTVSSGVLRVTHGNALGSTAGNTIVNLNSTLEIVNNAQGDEPVTLNGSGFQNLGALYSHSGSNRLGVIGGTDFRVTVANGTLATHNVAASADFNKFGLGTWVARRYFGARFDVLDGTAAVAPGRNNDKTSLLTALVIAGAAKMDLGDNDLVVDYGTITPFDTIRGYIASAYNGGAWNGNGLTSAQADANNFALGIGESSAVFTSFPANFSGIIVDNTAVLVRWTRYGDATLDGNVNLADFNKLAANFGTASGAVWTDGDFTYDGIINLADFNKLAANFGLSAGPDGVVDPEDWAALAAVVPEPAIGLLLLPPVLSLLARRQRRRQR